MQLWGRLYKPDVAILPLKATSDPQDAVEMVRLLRTENPNLKTVIPHHHRLQPPAAGGRPAGSARGASEVPEGAIPSNGLRRRGAPSGRQSQRLRKISHSLAGRLLSLRTSWGVRPGIQ